MAVMLATIDNTIVEALVSGYEDAYASNDVVAANILRERLELQSSEVVLAVWVKLIEPERVFKDGVRKELSWPRLDWLFEQFEPVLIRHLKIEMMPAVHSGETT